jgi:hypothetical protein
LLVMHAPTAAAEATVEEIDAAVARYDYFGARALADELVEAKPDDPAAHYAAAWVGQQGGWFVDAHRHLARARELAPGLDFDGLEALVYLDEGDDAAALRLVEAAERIDPASQEVIAARAMIEMATRARAGRAGAPGSVEGSAEAFIDEFVRAAVRGESAEVLARQVSAELVPSYPASEVRAMIPQVLDGALRRARTNQAMTLIGWYVEADPARAGPDPWIVVTLVAHRGRDAGLEDVLRHMKQDEYRAVMDPSAQAVMDATDPSQREAVMRHLLETPRRLTVELAFAVRGTGAKREIVGVTMHGGDVGGVVALAIKNQRGVADRQRKVVTNFLWLALVAAIGVGIGAVIWWSARARRRRRAGHSS